MLLLVGSAAGHEVNPPAEGSLEYERNDTGSRRDSRFFLRQIFNKYGDRGFITFEVSVVPQVEYGKNLTFPADIEQSLFCCKVTRDKRMQAQWSRLLISGGVGPLICPPIKIFMPHLHGMFAFKIHKNTPNKFCIFITESLNRLL
jgi:hypothetical protein